MSKIMLAVLGLLVLAHVPLAIKDANHYDLRKNYDAYAPLNYATTKDEQTAISEFIQMLESKASPSAIQKSLYAYERAGIFSVVGRAALLKIAQTRNMRFEDINFKVPEPYQKELKKEWNKQKKAAVKYMRVIEKMLFQMGARYDHEITTYLLNSEHRTWPAWIRPMFSSRATHFGLILFLLTMGMLLWALTHYLSDFGDKLIGWLILVIYGLGYGIGLAGQWFGFVQYGLTSSGMGGVLFLLLRSGMLILLGTSLVYFVRRDRTDVASAAHNLRYCSRCHHDLRHFGKIGKNSRCPKCQTLLLAEYQKRKIT